MGGSRRGRYVCVGGGGEEVCVVGRGRRCVCSQCRISHLLCSLNGKLY